MENSDIYQPDFIEELEKDIGQLRDKVKEQQNLLNGSKEWEGNELYQQVKQLELKRQEKQEEYKKLMKQRYQFVRNGIAFQNAGEVFLEQKLNKTIKGLTNQIENLLQSRTSKSSISSCNFAQVESMDWLLQERQEKHIKEQEKIQLEINELEKILQELR